MKKSVFVHDRENMRPCVGGGNTDEQLAQGCEGVYVHMCEHTYSVR